MHVPFYSFLIKMHSNSNHQVAPVARNFEDEPVTCPPGSVPETYTFKCPGDMCTPDNSKLSEPEKPKILPMSKLVSSNCESAKTLDNCADMDKSNSSGEEKKNLEDVIPPITCKIPDTKSFNCPGPDCSDKGAAECIKTEEKKIADTCNNNNTKKCGCGPVSGKPCKCPKNPPHRTPKAPGCDCKYGAICGPNTSCEVLPLTMKRK
ncbi:unnamed protein product [Orchesella dallaii]|uniref:Uncharacterized protein n=1 Tax=Orchesella dallaii TaxID=48710 RepID=A0ABP1RD06_9HEXA